YLNLEPLVQMIFLFLRCNTFILAFAECPDP
ncbi:MAG: hypothetical protein ACI9EW_003757, partial [Cellvibrionaceae bacterium]